MSGETFLLITASGQPVDISIDWSELQILIPWPSNRVAVEVKRKHYNPLIS